MNHKEIAERLASCGLTPDTLGAVILELIRTPAMINRQQNPAPDSSWQIGFGDALRFLELEAGKVSAELAQLPSIQSRTPLDPLPAPLDP